jgi:hypothetical protein
MANSLLAIPRSCEALPVGGLAALDDFRDWFIREVHAAGACHSSPVMILPAQAGSLTAEISLMRITVQSPHRRLLSSMSCANADRPHGRAVLYLAG